MRPYRILAALLWLLPLAAACEPELPGLVKFSGESDDGGTQTKSIELRIEGEDWPGTRTSLGSGVESIFSGAVLAAYDASTGRLDSEIEIAPEALGGRISISLPSGKSYNLYLLGNLWEIGSDGLKRGVPFPADEASLEDLFYRMDGGSAGGGYRRETFAEAATYGIPLCWSQTGVKVPSTATVQVQMKRLFARLTVEVDHSGIAGSSLEAFVNGSLKLRQVNSRLMPFAPGGSRALSLDDVLPYGDADSAMENALCREFVYYVPENRQGVLLPGNTDPSAKTLDNVGTALGGLVSYVEFKADIGPASGFSGSTVYRFLLGKDAVADFDIERGLSFKVSLGFNAESLFSPDWKVQVDGLADTREFYLSGALAGRIPDGKKVVVRKNRAAELDLNLEMSGGGANAITSAKLVDGGYSAANLTDVAWTSDFWSATHNSANEPQREALSALGIAVSYAGGRFLFEVSDPSRFVSGKSVPLTLTLYPGTRTITAEIVTRDDITVSGDTGAPEDPIYVAQCRTLSFSGFEGSTLYYIADQSANSGGKHTYNTHWKTSPSLSAAFPGYYKLASDGSVIYPFDEPGSYASQSLSAGETLQFCCFAPTDTRAYDGKKAPGSLIICSDDPLNDGITTIPLNIILPKLTVTSDYSRMVISFDGNEIDLDAKFTNADGTALAASDFNSDLFEALLKPTIKFDETACPWLANLSFDFFESKVYFAKTTLGTLKVEDAFPYDPKYSNQTYNLGSLSISMPKLLYFQQAPSRKFSLSIPRLGELSSQKDSISYYFGDSGTEAFIHRQLICCQMEGDTSRFEFTYTNNGCSFTCKSGKVLRPLIEAEYNGSTIYSWRYNETSQPSVVDGEYVPGGLILPYGPQTVTLTVTNKWDGRKLFTSSTFDIKYSTVLYQIGLFHNSKIATVYPLPLKNITYMTALNGKAENSTLKWMLKVLGSDEWLKHYYSGPDFRINYVYKRNLPSSGKKILWSKNNYPVTYFDSSAGKWTEALAKKTFEASTDIWLNGIYDENGNSIETDPAITGNKYLSLIYSTRKEGYVYNSSKTDPWF